MTTDNMNFSHKSIEEAENVEHEQNTETPEIVEESTSSSTNKEFREQIELRSSREENVPQRRSTTRHKSRRATTRTGSERFV